MFRVVRKSLQSQSVSVLSRRSFVSNTIVRSQPPTNGADRPPAAPATPAAPQTLCSVTAAAAKAADAKSGRPPLRPDASGAERLVYSLGPKGLTGVGYEIGGFTPKPVDDAMKRKNFFVAALLCAFVSDSHCTALQHTALYQ